MKIYVAQYYDSMSPMGVVVAVASKQPKVQAQAQEYEESLCDEPETLEWASEQFPNRGPWVADGFSGSYSISEWEVVPP